MRLRLAVLFIVGGLIAAARAAAGAPVRIDDFGDNPGNLEMWAYSPETASGAAAPLVVVLHGCTQQATSMAPGGFESLADERGFHILYPQQKSANNPAGCFNWAGEYGDPANLERGKGENRSIISMVETMKARHSIDPARVYLIGFSAGGAFTAVLLATWPDVFAAGAIAAGVPYRCATDQQGAFDCMNLATHPERKKSPRAWGELVRAAYSAWDGPWPRVMILHGTGDFTVQPDAADELVEQWTSVHGIDVAADETAEVAGHRRERFIAGGSAVVESWRVEGMGHAFPIGPSDPQHGCGQVAAYFEDRGLCGAYRALEFFGMPGGDGGDGDDGGDGGGDGGGGNGGAGAGGGGGGGGCGLAGASGGAGSAASLFYVLLLLFTAPARRRSSTRSILPAPVRGSSRTSS